MTNDIRIAEWVDDLLSADTNQQQRAVAEAEKERAQVIAALAVVLKEKETKENRTKIESAIQIAGTLRATELTEVLIDKIKFPELGICPMPPAY